MQYVVIIVRKTYAENVVKRHLEKEMHVQIVECHHGLKENTQIWKKI